MTPPSQKPYSDAMHAADVATFTQQISHLQRTVDGHVKDDKEIQALLFVEVNMLKCLVWIQIGGFAALAWIVALIGHDILKYLK